MRILIYILLLSSFTLTASDLKDKYDKLKDKLPKTENTIQYATAKLKDKYDKLKDKLPKTENTILYATAKLKDTTDLFYFNGQLYALRKEIEKINFKNYSYIKYDTKGDPYFLIDIRDTNFVQFTNKIKFVEIPK